MRSQQYLGVRNRHLPFVICIFLILSTYAVFGQVFSNDFTNLDDNLYVTENPYVQAGITVEGILWAFRSTFTGHWHPLTWLSHMLDCQFYGLNPGGHHLTSLLLHIINSLLLFVILRRMTGAIWQSTFVAALFALHPLHVESVAWVAQRKDVMSTSLWMLTIWAYVRYTDRPNLGRYVPTLLLFALGLMTKATLVTLPFVLLLLDYWPLGRYQLRRSSPDGRSETLRSMNRPHYKSRPLSLVREKIPFFAFAAASSVMTILVQQQRGTIISLESLPLATRISSALVSYAGYIWKMIWPKSLAVYYPHPGMLPAWQVAAAALLLLCASTLSFHEARRRPYLIVGLLWYLGTLVPFIGLVDVGLPGIMADKFTYVSLIGLFIIFGWGVPDALTGWRHRRVVLALSGALLISSFSIVTSKQINYWHDSTTLFEHALNVTSNNFVAHNNLGFSLAKRNKLAQAIFHYNETLRIKPDCERAHNNLGMALVSQGRMEEAIVHYREALRLRPEYVQAHNNLGIALVRLGRIDEGTAHFDEVLRIQPYHVKAHNNLGLALSQQGKLDEAIGHYDEALKLKPDFVEARYNLGVAYYRQGKLVEAIAQYIEALKIRSESPEIHFSLGLAYLGLGDRYSALQEYGILRKDNPDLAGKLLKKLNEKADNTIYSDHLKD